MTTLAERRRSLYYWWPWKDRKAADHLRHVMWNKRRLVRDQLDDWNDRVWALWWEWDLTGLVRDQFWQECQVRGTAALRCARHKPAVQAFATGSLYADIFRPLWARKGSGRVYDALMGLPDQRWTPIGPRIDQELREDLLRGSSQRV